MMDEYRNADEHQEDGFRDKKDDALAVPRINPGIERAEKRLCIPQHYQDQNCMLHAQSPFLLGRRSAGIADVPQGVGRDKSGQSQKAMGSPRTMMTLGKPLCVRGAKTKYVAR